VPPLVAVEELTQTSSDEEMGRWMEELELGVSEALGISLSEVRARYFLDSDKSENRDRYLASECECERWLEEWAQECRLGNQSY
jgi:hypothetical protein